MARLEDGVLQNRDACHGGEEEERRGEANPELVDDHPDDGMNFVGKSVPGSIFGGVSIDDSGESVDDEEGRHPAEPLRGFGGH